MKQFYLSIILIFSFAATCFSQINFNANTPGSAPAYTSPFLFGSNMGYYPPWTNQTIADIAAGNTALNVKGAGVKSLHLPLPENFLDTWGYNISVNDFIHYNQLGIKDNTVFLEFPTAAHSDNTIYPGCTNPSKIWSNIYEPIWDGGANGTPVNENNYFALYVYKTVTIYKPYVKFWEIVNEPDFDAGVNGWKSPGDPGNWWDNNPSPCDLTNLYAPIFNYIRMMRIMYEVVKSIDPNAYVAMGGTGYPSFYDAILRNTDNPSNGVATTDYPATGGAYFDCTSFHYYPMYDLQYWNGTATVPTRYSDAAVDHFVSRKKAIDAVLLAHGYNDTLYPRKVFINTENNIPRKSINGLIGSDEAQRNYDMKAIVAAQINNVRQWYIFSIGDSKTLADATDPFDVVGLYQPLGGVNPYNQQYNSSGIAYKTFSDVLGGASPDTAQTRLMNLPADVRGGAFKSNTGNYIYVLWAATTIDNSEVDSATYSFPAAMNVPLQLTQQNWDFSQTNASTTISSQNIALTGSPVLILTPLIITALNPDTIRNTAASYFSFTLYPNPVKENLNVKLHLKKREAVSIKITDGAGQLVMQVADNTMYNTGDNLIHLSLPARLAAGIYYCRLVTGSNDQTVKFVVRK
jgi:Secretion system C-terminal sorting domain